MAEPSVQIHMVLFGEEGNVSLGRVASLLVKYFSIGHLSIALEKGSTKPLIPPSFWEHVVYISP